MFGMATFFNTLVPLRFVPILCFIMPAVLSQQPDLHDLDILRRFPGNCSKNMFDCGEKCISRDQFRDCTQDCANGIDEDCWTGSMKCDGCRCVDPKDANRYCLDRNQANNKLCTITGRYVCSNKQCVLREWVADGRNDCGDWSDENPCLNGANPCPSKPGVICRFIKPNGFTCGCASSTDSYVGGACVPITITSTPPPTTPIPTVNPPIQRKCNLPQLTNLQKPAPASLGVVFNTKLSMNIDHNLLVGSVLETWFSTVLAEPKIKNFLLLPYGPGIGDIVRTTSVQQMYEAIQQLSGTARADCTDPVMAAITAAIQSVEPTSVIFVVTDGAARDFSQVDTTREAALNKSARINFIITGTCPVNDSVSNVFSQLAGATGGDVFRIEKSASDYNAVLQYTKRQLRQNFTTIDRGRFINRGTLVVSSDAGMDEFLVSVAGTNVTLQMNATNSYTYVVNLPNVKAVSFTNPVPEYISIIATATGPVQLHATTVGMPSMNVMLSANPLLPNAQIGGAIYFGSPAQAIISASAGTIAKGFPLLTVTVKEVENGSVLYEGPLKLNRTDSSGREIYMSGKFFPTCRPFVIEVFGINDCNERIQRMAGPFQAVPTDYTSRIPGSCSQGQLNCFSGGCVPVNAIRDFRADCPSGEDEARQIDDYSCNTNCSTCPGGIPAPGTPGGASWCTRPSVLKCSNGVCVPLTWQNDGFDDCGDGTDEKPPTTTPASSTTTTTTAKTTSTSPGSTTPRDSYPATLDPPPNLTTDEVYRRIFNNTCNKPPGRYFQCTDGTCIVIEKFRDCTFNCRDGSDEVCPSGLTKCPNNCKCAAQSSPACSDSQIREICSRSNMYPCRAPDYCTRMVDLLNGVQNCPDGSDEDPAYLDECYLGFSHCDKHAYCRNIPGGAFECVCVFGFQGNGTYCDVPHSRRRRRR